MKVCLLDALPSYYVWTNANMRWALNSWHWLFLAQPEPIPETMISAVPAEWFLTARGRRSAPKIVMDEYIRCFTKKTIYGSCRDYRANAGIDFQMQQEFYDLIRDLNRRTGITILLVSHDLSVVAKMAHHVLCLKDRRISCEGAPEAILTSEVLTRTFGPDTSVFHHHHS